MHSLFPKQRYEVPIVMKAVFDYIDTLSTRIREIEQQRNFGVMCNKEDKSRSLENFLSRFVNWFKYTKHNGLNEYAHLRAFPCVLRFRWRRRLFIISSPSDEEWAFQQQLYTINSQACNFGKVI